MPFGRRAYRPRHGAARRQCGAGVVYRTCLAPDPALRPRIRTLDMTAHKRQITHADILPPAEYAAQRSELRKQVVALKRNRRIEVGPVATFYFESFETMLQQIQEMLYIEKGGAEQIDCELAA